VFDVSNVMFFTVTLKTHSINQLNGETKIMQHLYK